LLAAGCWFLVVGKRRDVRGRAFAFTNNQQPATNNQIH
jgi:hypothetical protein